MYVIIALFILGIYVCIYLFIIDSRHVLTLEQVRDS
jgi:type II secretory pathway component PulF